MIPMPNEDPPVDFNLEAPPKEATLQDDGLVVRIVEAALLASPHPLTTAQLYALFPEDQPAARGSIEQALANLRDACTSRGVTLVEVASGFRFQVQPEVQAWVSRLFAERPQRYTRATLETLALIAYRQPITRAQIEAIRGVDCSTLVRQLQARELVCEVGRLDTIGRPVLFGTTEQFLRQFGLTALAELPPLIITPD